MSTEGSPEHVLASKEDHPAVSTRPRMSPVRMPRTPPKDVADRQSLRRAGARNWVEPCNGYPPNRRPQNRVVW